MGKFKFFWMGCKGGATGVGFLVAERWVQKVLEVKRVSARLMLVRVIAVCAELGLSVCSTGWKINGRERGILCLFI